MKKIIGMLVVVMLVLVTSDTYAQKETECYKSGKDKILCEYGDNFIVIDNSIMWVKSGVTIQTFLKDSNYCSYTISKTIPPTRNNREYRSGMYKMCMENEKGYEQERTKTKIDLNVTKEEKDKNKKDLDEWEKNYNKGK